VCGRALCVLVVGVCQCARECWSPFLIGTLLNTWPSFPLSHTWRGTPCVSGAGSSPQRGERQQATLSSISSLSGCRALSSLRLPATLQSRWCLMQQGVTRHMPTEVEAGARGRRWGMRNTPSEPACRSSTPLYRGEGGGSCWSPTNVIQWQLLNV